MASLFLKFKQGEELPMTKEFRLMSVNVIAYVKTKGIKPIRIEKNEDGNVAHYFEDTDDLHFYLREYKKDIKLQDFITKLTETRKQIKSLV